MEENKTFSFMDLTIEFDKELISKLLIYKQDKKYKSEKGGIITGYIYPEKIFVMNISIPTKYDCKSRFNFIRSKRSAQDFIDSKFKQSNGSEVYLGEWHTHPENYPTPSYTDIQSFKKTIMNNVLNSTIFFMIIVGIKEILIDLYHDFENKYRMSIPI